MRLRSKPAGRVENGSGTGGGTLHDSKPLEGFEKSDPKSWFLRHPGCYIEN